MLEWGLRQAWQNKNRDGENHEVNKLTRYIDQQNKRVGDTLDQHANILNKHDLFIADSKQKRSSKRKKVSSLMLWKNQIYIIRVSCLVVMQDSLHSGLL